MSKKQTTIYLSEDIYVYLIDYKDKNRLNNLSTVIERLVLERMFREQGKLDINTNIDNKLNTSRFLNE